MPNWFPLTRPNRGSGDHGERPAVDEGVRPELPRRAKRRRSGGEPESRPEAPPPGQ